MRIHCEFRELYNMGYLYNIRYPTLPQSRRHSLLVWFSQRDARSHARAIGFGLPESVVYHWEHLIATRSSHTTAWENVLVSATSACAGCLSFPMQLHPTRCKIHDRTIEIRLLELLACHWEHSINVHTVLRAISKTLENRVLVSATLVY